MCDHVQEVTDWKSMLIKALWVFSTINFCCQFGFVGFWHNFLLETQYYMITSLGLMVTFLFLSVQTGEDGMSGQKHAGQASAWSLYHSETWGIIHWAVDRWICLPKSYQVRNSLVYQSPVIVHETKIFNQMFSTLWKFNYITFPRKLQIKYRFGHLHQVCLFTLLTEMDTLEKV